MRHSLSGLALTLSVLALALPARVAWAQDGAASQAHIAQGEALFEAGNFDAALAELEEAYRLLEGDPARYYLLWNIGQCHERLFRYDRALAYYRRYLDEGGLEAEDRATVEATMRALDSLLGTVRITTNVEQAELWIDDVLVGVAPGSVRVTGGRHTLELRAPGYLNARREVQLAARGELDEDVPLEAVPEDTRIDPVWCALSGGAALVLAGVGTGFWAHAQSQWDAAHGIDLGGGAQDAIDAAALTGDVLFGAAALFAITSLVLGIFTRWDAPSDEGELRAFLAPSFDGLSVGVGGSL